MKTRRLMILHPFLFAAYPVLLLAAKNPDEVLPSDVARAFLFLGVLVLLSLSVLRFMFKDWLKAGVLLTAIIIMFFGYPSIYNLLENLQVGSFEIGRHRILLPAWALTFALLFVVMRFARRDLSSLSHYLNLVGVILVIMCLCNIGLGAFKAAPGKQMTDNWSRVIAAEEKSASGLRWTGNGKMPDIYYIILDQYVREDVLKRDFGYDNSDFISYLTEKGFYVAGGSRSNYPHTHWSLPSSLNYDTLEALRSTCGTEAMSYALLQKAIKESKCRHVLERMGYRFIQPASAFNVTQGGSEPDRGLLSRALQMNEFDRVLIDSTVLGPMRLSDSGARKRHLETFKYLGRIPKMPEPTFSLIHINCPHPPYVFKRDGTAPGILTRLRAPLTSESKSCYVEQLEYCNVLTRKAIDQILASSGPQPIVIIQSDHGHLPYDFFNDPKWDPKSEKARMAMDMRTAILNAYYFPDTEKRPLYDTITPVNSFRVLLNTYFSGKYELLPDEVYFPKSPVAQWNPPCCEKNMVEVRDLLPSWAPRGQGGSTGRPGD